MPLGCALGDVPLWHLPHRLLCGARGPRPPDPPQRRGLLLPSGQSAGGGCGIPAASLRLAAVRLPPRLRDLGGMQRLDQLGTEGEDKLVALECIRCKVVVVFRSDSGEVVLLPCSNMSKRV